MLTGFLRAARLLTLEHVLLDRDLPYQTQLVPLAAILAELGDKWEEIGTKQKVRQWYWSGVLGELYGGANREPPRARPTGSLGLDSGRRTAPDDSPQL